MQRDASPRVRITKPGRDLFVDSARRVLEVRIEASDDIALHALSLHYTTVAGAGERFTFQEGQTPLRTVKTSREAWHADATLPLDSLLREPGDLVVYRAQAADGRLEFLRSNRTPSLLSAPLREASPPPDLPWIRMRIATRSANRW